MTVTGPVFGSDMVVDLLEELGIDFVACAPGATFRGLHDSLVNYGNGTPELILCLHEEIAVAVAHGYAKASGTLMAVAIHDVVGLQHATMALYNAWCDRVPVLALGGSGPADAAQRRPWIDWIHTANVQANQVRDYTKWDDQPASLEAVPDSLIRGVRLAEAAPSAPVYVCLDSALQEQRVPEGFSRRQVAQYARSSPLAPDPNAVDQLAARLVSARWPLIVAESIGRDQRAVSWLTQLAQLLGCATTEIERSYNREELCFPSHHPMNVTGVQFDEEPDVVLALEARDPGTIQGSGHTWVAVVSTAELRVKAWAADLQQPVPAAMHIPAEVPATLFALLPRVAELLDGDADARSRAVDRAAAITERVSAARAAWASQAASAGTGSAITQSYLAHALGAALRGRKFVLANGTLGNWTHRLWDLGDTRGYLGGSGGAGLGYGLGASVGAALAHRETGRLVVDIQSDGDALMTPQALWTAAHYSLPLLIVMDNNRAYGNSVDHANRIARTRGRSLVGGTVGTTITKPAVDFAELARSMGVPSAGPVSSPDELPGALAQALAAMDRHGGPFLLDVVVG